MTNENVPYANLDPNLILEAIENVGYACSGGLLALNSFENRVYQVGIDDGPPIIAKFYRPHRWTDAAILEEHQFSLELLEHEIPVVAPLVSASGETLHHHKGYRFALFPRKGGRALELENLDQLEWIGRFLGRLHAVSACRPFKHRMQLNAKTYGHDPYHYLLDNNFIPENIKINYTRTVESILSKIDHAFQFSENIEYIRLHGDCHASNILWRDEGLHIVDLDDCLMGPAIQDIWMLLSGNVEQVSIQLDHILNGYCEFHDYNPQELHLIEPLRTLRMLHYSAWLAKRWEDPAFPMNFPWFNTPRYWEDQLQDLREQETLLDETVGFNR